MPETLIPEDLTEKQLKWGYWFVSHKILLRRIFVAFLIAINAALLGFAGYGLVADILNARERERMMAALAGSQLDLVARDDAPRSLVMGQAQALSAGGKYDFIASLKNPNRSHYAHFSYRFVAGAVSTPFQKGFILPESEKFLVELGFVSDVRPSGATLEIANIEWERVDRHAVPDWSAYAREHLNFQISDISYDSAIEIAPGKPPIGRTYFKIVNSTGYAYYDLKVLVLMYKGPVLAAINSAVFPIFAPGAIETGEVTWYEDYGAISEIKVLPEIDVTDQASYLRK